MCMIDLQGLAQDLAETQIRVNSLGVDSLSGVHSHKVDALAMERWRLAGRREC